MEEEGGRRREAWAWLTTGARQDELDETAPYANYTSLIASNQAQFNEESKMPSSLLGYVPKRKPVPR